MEFALKSEWLLYGAGIIIFLIAFYFFAGKFFEWRNLKSAERKLKKEYAEKQAALKEKFSKAHEIAASDDMPYNENKNRDTFRKVINWFKRKFLPHKVMLIHMELINGMHREFLTAIRKDGTFRYRGKMYYVDNEMKYYCIDAKLWCADFHENISIPVRRAFPSNLIRKSAASSGMTEIEYMLNPSVLEEFSISKVAEGVMKGAQIDAFFRQIRLMIIIILVAAVIHLMLFIQASGMLKNLKMPF